MSTAEKWVTTTEALVATVKDESVGRVVISGQLTNVPSISLSPGRSLCGATENSMIAFVPGNDGVQLSTDNSVHSLHLEASPEKRAIFNDTVVATLGRIELRGVTVSGCVQILARGTVRSGHVNVDGLEIIAADARAQAERARRLGAAGRFHALELAARQ
jgi:hypothetical protein